MLGNLILRTVNIGRIVCFVRRKHKRGKRLRPTDPPHVSGDQNVTRYQCSRCGATWARKIKAKEGA
jgi:hypothetical protein